MSNSDLIERLRNAATFGTCLEAADALELADKRIAELENRCRWHEEGSASIVGYPWDTPFQDGLKTGRRELLDELDEAERKLSVARDELLRCKRIMLHECGIGLVNEVVLAQIGGDE